jgi:hypothetical protein
MGPLRLDLRGNMWLGYNRTTAPTSSETHALFVTGKVGIGTSGPTGSVHLKDVVDSNGSDVFYVAQNTTSNRIAGYQVLDESGTVSLAMQYDNGGNAASITNPNNGSLAVYLGGSAAANALDDYEEGTWTPTITGYSQGTPHSQTYATQTGTYTKVGNLVHAHFVVTLSNKGNIASGSGNYSFISNLPFNHAGTTAGSGVMWGWAGLTNAVSHVACDISSTTTVAWLTECSGTSSTATSYIGTAQFTNTTSFRGTLIYRTA